MDENLTTTGADMGSAAGNQNSLAGGDTPLARAGADNSADRAEENRAVPVSVLQSVRDELKTARDQATLYRRQLEMTRTTDLADADPFSGMADETPLTVGQAKKALQGQAGQVNALASQLSFSMANPGFAETIKKNLPQIINKNPGLLQVIRASPNPLAAAYSIARLTHGVQGATGPDFGAQANRIVENSEKPGSASAASGGAGISAASRIAKMSDAEFAEYKEMVKAGKIKIGG